jgi:GrpB-like predicted nucleotidyltransferase (UPF0157 family)
MTHPNPIEICPYSSKWPEWFATERELLEVVFSSADVQIEHIGSTAVPGLGAKPIIDILLGAPSLSLIKARIPSLVALDYQYMPEHETIFPNRRFFAKPKIRPRRYHLHAVELYSDFWYEHLAFRDALRSDPKLACEYENLKRELALRCGYDREAYTDGKDPFVHPVLERIFASKGKSWAANPPLEPTARFGDE